MPPLVLPSPPDQTALPPDMPMGRVFAPDTRDGLFRARSMQPAALGVPVVRRQFRAFFPPRATDWRSQGDQQSCTEHALTNKLCGWPMPRRIATLPWQQHELYRLAQTMDEWPGSEPRYYGTSGRAICRAAREKGVVDERWNAFTVDEVLDLLLADSTDWRHYGPVLIGTNWYASMSRADDKGFLEIAPVGRVLGGHETCLIGANMRSETLYGISSWTHMRLFRLRFATFERLLREDGDAIFPVETARLL
jgi:hypothetical protein